MVVVGAEEAANELLLEDDDDAVAEDDDDVDVSLLLSLCAYARSFPLIRSVAARNFLLGELEFEGEWGGGKVVEAAAAAAAATAVVPPPAAVTAAARVEDEGEPEELAEVKKMKRGIIKGRDRKVQK